MKRFYPDSLPAFANEPSVKKFAIQKISQSVGEGVVALVPFSRGEIVCAFTGYLVNVITQYSLMLGPGQHVHDPYFMGKVLHSCDPNTFCDMKRRVFVARKHIKAGEWVTMDYAQTEEELFKPFPCSCGSVNCRGFITGRAEAAAVAGNFL